MTGPRLHPLMKRLIAARIAAGISQRDVAHAMGRTSACLSHWESGNRQIDLRDAATYAQVIGHGLTLGITLDTPEQTIDDLVNDHDDGHAGETIRRFHPHVTSELKKARLARGWTLQALARHLGKGTSTVWNWERGIREPRHDDLFAWAEALDHQVKFNTKPAQEERTTAA
jgi:transcriptional regulator with XRE-family HTH domain